MPVKRSVFKYIDRGFGETILLLPGWAADCRIFDQLDLDFNYLAPEILSLNDFDSALPEALGKAGLDRVSIMGSSMGGFLAADFAQKYPDIVNDITFLGMRARYDKEEIKKVKHLLASGAQGYLYGFYKSCFSPDERSLLSDFKKTLMKDYIRNADAVELNDGLDYLERSAIDTAALKKMRVRFIQGDCDRIAPLESLDAVRKDIPEGSFTVVNGGGHLPFLRKDFKRIFYG